MLALGNVLCVFIKASDEDESRNALSFNIIELTALFEHFISHLYTNLYNVHVSFTRSSALKSKFVVVLTFYLIDIYVYIYIYYYILIYVKVTLPKFGGHSILLLLHIHTLGYI